MQCASQTCNRAPSTTIQSHHRPVSQWHLIVGVSARPCVPMPCSTQPPAGVSLATIPNSQRGQRSPMQRQALQKGAQRTVKA
jgi:hypothetical protein